MNHISQVGFSWLRNIVNWEYINNCITYASGNIILSYLSAYQMRVLELESPSGWVTNFVSLLIISYQYNNRLSDKSDRQDNQKSSYFECLHHIYYYNSSNSEDKKPKIYWTRVVLTFVVAALHIMQHWVFIMGYFYASLL